MLRVSIPVPDCLGGRKERKEKNSVSVVNHTYLNDSLRFNSELTSKFAESVFISELSIRYFGI